MSELLTQDLGGTPLWNWLLQAIGLASSYAGAELNARMKVSGFYIWIGSNVCLGILHATSGLWGLLVLDLLFFKVNCQGIARWRERSSQQKTLRRMEPNA